MGEPKGFDPQKQDDGLSIEDLDKVAGGQTIGGGPSPFEIANPDPWGVTQPGGPNRDDGVPGGG